MESGLRKVWDFIPNNTKEAFEQTRLRCSSSLDLTDPYTLSALASCQLLPKGREPGQRAAHWALPPPEAPPGEGGAAGQAYGAVERVEEQCLPLNDLNFSQCFFV
nr:hypothetical protein BaRGS_013374 [Batillaria attramentaria]